MPETPEDAARRAGVHPLQALWDLNAMPVTPEQTEAADMPADPSVSDTDDDDDADDPAQNATPSRDPASGGQASGSSLGGGSPSPPSEQGIMLTQHGGQVADGNDPSPIDQVVVTGKRQAPRSGSSAGSQPAASFALSAKGAKFMKGMRVDATATSLQAPIGHWKAARLPSAGDTRFSQERFSTSH